MLSLAVFSQGKPFRKLVAVVFADKAEKRADRGIVVAVVFVEKEEKRADRGIMVAVVFAEE